MHRSRRKDGLVFVGQPPSKASRVNYVTNDMVGRYHLIRKHNLGHKRLGLPEEPRRVPECVSDLFVRNKFEKFERKVRRSWIVYIHAVQNFIPLIRYYFQGSTVILISRYTVPVVGIYIPLFDRCKLWNVEWRSVIVVPHQFYAGIYIYVTNPL